MGIAPAQVHAEVAPGGKAELVRAIQAAGRRVAMVGDGVNDASALAVANVGLAMGGGVDAASEAASIVLLHDQLSQVGPTLRDDLFHCTSVILGPCGVHVWLPWGAASVQHQGRCWQVVDALQLSQRTFRKIQQNLGWAFAYNIVALPLAAGALLPSCGLALTPSLAGEELLQDQYSGSSVTDGEHVPD